MMTSNNIILVETTVGNFSVELYTNHAPTTCQNFSELSRMGQLFVDVR